MQEEDDLSAHIEFAFLALLRLAACLGNVPSAQLGFCVGSVSFLLIATFSNREGFFHGALFILQTDLLLEKVWPSWNKEGIV